MELSKIPTTHITNESKDLLHDIDNMFTIIDGKSFKLFHAFTLMDSKIVILNNNLYNAWNESGELRFGIKLDDSIPDNILICTSMNSPDDKEIFYDLSGIIKIENISVK